MLEKIFNIKSPTYDLAPLYPSKLCLQMPRLQVFKYRQTQPFPWAAWQPFW